MISEVGKKRERRIDCLPPLLWYVSHHASLRSQDERPTLPSEGDSVAEESPRCDSEEGAEEGFGNREERVGEG